MTYHSAALGHHPVLKSYNSFGNKKYVLWNVYLPNVVAFNTPLSKYFTVTVMTLNYEGSKSSKVQRSWPNRKPVGGFLSDLHCVQRRISHRIRDIWCQNPVTLNYDGSRSFKLQGHGANRKLVGGFLSDLHCVQRKISHRIRDIWCQNPVWPKWVDWFRRQVD